MGAVETAVGAAMVLGSAGFAAAAVRDPGLVEVGMVAVGMVVVAMEEGVQAAARAAAAKVGCSAETKAGARAGS